MRDGVNSQAESHCNGKNAINLFCNQANIEDSFSYFFFL